MKELFSKENITNSDIAKRLFEKSWLRSASGKPANQEVKTRKTLLSSGSAGYGAPAIISSRQEDEDV